MGGSSLDGVRSAVLIAEPEPETRADLERQLHADGFEVLGATWNGEALDLVESARPHVVLAAELDLCRRLRSGAPGRRWDRNVPFVYLAPRRAGAPDHVRAFDAGADDVVDRPFVYLELLARIRALLRRTNGDSREVIDADPIVVDRRTRTVTVRGTPVRLAGREFELAVRLASDPRRVFTRDELLHDLWGIGAGIRTRTLDSHASRLRRKLCLDPGDAFVVNVWGVGYRLLD